VAVVDPRSCQWRLRFAPAALSGSFKTCRATIRHAVSMTSIDHEYAELRDGIRGAVVLPGDEGWDDARRGWNLSVDQRPAAVVEAAGPEDVQAAVRFAARGGLRIAPQSTGHGSEVLDALEGALLLKTSRMRSVSVDPDAGLARVDAGARAGDVAGVAGAHGLAPVLGLSPTVGVTGLALAGGVGWLSRAHGLAANSVNALDVVLASGERRHVDADSQPDLFWALRGGGGRSAIVTSVELRAYRLPEVCGGMLVWPAERARDVLALFRELTLDAPEALSLVFRFIAIPDIEGPPPPLRGRKIVAVIAVNLGGEPGGVARLRTLGGALADTFKAIEPAELVRVAGDPEDPAPARGDGFMLDTINDETVERLADSIGSEAFSSLTIFEIRHLGGALASPPEAHGALGALSASYSVFGGGVAGSAGAGAAVDRALDAVRETLGPWVAPQALLSSARAGTDPAQGFDADTWMRLRAIERAYDPDGLILSNRKP
jgi:FAD/FMN-containing dehydrogenase